MKIRNSFVSNSSSTSFTCNACGENVIGRDMGLSEAEMFECENGHTICEYRCSKDWRDGLTEENTNKFIEEKFDETKKSEKKYREDSNYSMYYGSRKMPTDEEIRADLQREFREEYRNSVPKEFCPVCNFKVVSRYDHIPYVCYKLGIKRSDIPNMIKDEFSSYEDFRKAIENVRS